MRRGRPARGRRNENHAQSIRERQNLEVRTNQESGWCGLEHVKRGGGCAKARPERLSRLVPNSVTQGQKAPVFLSGSIGCSSDGDRWPRKVDDRPGLNVLLGREAAKERAEDDGLGDHAGRVERT